MRCPRLPFLSRSIWLLLIACAWLAVPATLKAQTAAAASAPADGPAAAVPAANSLELPVLVVDHQHRPVDDVKLDRLKVKIGAGAPFAPISMRTQGEDPVSLAVFVDASRDSFHDLQRLGDEFASLVGSELLPNDRITVYAADCAMTRSLSNAAPDPAVLRKGFADALNFPTLHNGQKSSACGKTFHLWDNIAAVVAGLSHAPGRRVLFVISSGADGASKYDWLTVQQYAFDNGVAIFALRDQRQADADDLKRNSLTTTHQTFGYNPTMTPPPTPRTLTNIELLCANDGGLTLSAAPEFRKDAIADILFLIRKRFIVTIPKDAYQPGTAHAAKVTQAGVTPYFYSATGAGEPLPVK